MKNILIVIKEIIDIAWKKIAWVWSTLGFLWSITSVVISFQECPYVFLSILGMKIFMSVIFIIHAVIVYNKTMLNIPLKLEIHKQFCIMKGDYIENMQKVRNARRWSSDKIAFAMGADRTMKIEKLNKKGIFWSLVRYWDTNGEIMEQDLQNYIDKAKQQQFGIEADAPLQYGDILKVIIPNVINVENGENKGDLRLLLIANSERTDDGEEDSIITKADFRIIIAKLFNKCEELQCSTLLLGAIGTNQLHLPYPIVITEIINAYIYSGYHGTTLNNVLLSIRREDIKKYGVKQSRMVSYIHRILQLYKK